jgi:medium-chain acyl-[acyl-carrier-protein] hydrolase
MKHHYEITVPSFLCRPDDQLGFDGMASIFQEAAWQHAQRLGVDFTDPETPVYWVLHRLGMRFLRRPRWGETIGVTTWPSRMVRLYAMREFLVESDGELLVEASSAWIVLDGSTGRPVRPEKHLSADWGVKEVPLSLPEGKAGTIEAPQTALERAEWDRVRPSDTDRNAHVNNSRYTQWLSDWAPEVVTPDQPGVFTFTAETRQGQEYAILTGAGSGTGAIAEVWVRNSGDAADRAVCACRYHPIP